MFFNLVGTGEYARHSLQVSLLSLLRPLVDLLGVIYHVNPPRRVCHIGNSHDLEEAHAHVVATRLGFGPLKRFDKSAMTPMTLPALFTSTLSHQYSHALLMVLQRPSWSF